MRGSERKVRAVRQELARHGSLAGPLNRAARRALQMEKVPCPDCEKRIQVRNLTDHYLTRHQDKVPAVG